MGRARRNQRDAKRKQRAKRRKRGGLDNSSDDSDIEIDTNIIDDVSIDLLDAILAGGRVVAPTIVTIIDNRKETKNDGSTSSSFRKKKLDRGTKSIVAKKVGTNIGKKDSTTTEENDRIERMRLKKQQHKARRKEKKEARETAALAVASTRLV